MILRRQVVELIEEKIVTEYDPNVKTAFKTSLVRLKHKKVWKWIRCTSRLSCKRKKKKSGAPQKEEISTKRKRSLPLSQSSIR